MGLLKSESQRLKEEIARLRKLYWEELKRKDDLIEELRRSNELLLRNAISQAVTESKILGLSENRFSAREEDRYTEIYTRVIRY